MDLMKSLTWRYATKAFDPERKISETDINTLREVMRLAPSSFGLQPWKIYMVTNQQVKESLVVHSWNQRQVVDCSHLVVLTSLKSMTAEYIQNFIKLLASERGVSAESLAPYQGMMEGALLGGGMAKDLGAWTARQAYILMGFLMMAAAELEIDSCPMEGIIPAEFDRILGVDDAYATVAAVPLGYRSQDDKYATAQKVRFSAEQVFVDIV
ncbi:MAG: NAD(P)H-dependent oxidoreductase [bacterium]|nr:NAD(P)H-dependent oxidoreductase [bacterium]